MVTPIIDPVVEPSVTPALYPVPPIPVLSVVDPVPVLVASPLQQVGESRFGISPCRAWYRLLAPSQISPSLRSDDVARPPMDQYLPRDASLFLGESTDFPFLPAPLASRQITEKLVSGSVVSSQNEEPVAVAPPSMSDLSLGAPLTFIGTIRSRVPLHGCWTVCGSVNTA